MTDTKQDDWFDADYVVPVDASSYMKLEDGKNKFRILSKPVTGFEYWTEDNKPVRQKENWEVLPEDAKKRDGKTDGAKHFWSFLVYNYKPEQVQSYEITQKTIMKSISDLVTDDAWGNPMGYDITITKTGEKLTTKYAVTPAPHSPISEKIQKAKEESKIDLEEIFK